MYPRILSCVFDWAKSNGRCSIEIEKRGLEVGVRLRTWEKSIFRFMDLKEGDGRVSVPESACLDHIQAVSSASRSL